MNLIYNVGFGHECEFDSVWAKNFIDKMDSIVQPNEMSIMKDLETLQINVTDINYLIELFEDMGKIYYRNMPVIFNNKGIIRIKAILQKNYLALFITIFTASMKCFHELKTQILKKLKPYTVNDNAVFINFHWYFSTSNDMVDDTYFNEIIDEIFYREAYPYILSVDDYINDYLESRESVLIVIGIPGSGKSRFIRHILKKMSMKYRREIKVSYTSDKSVIQDMRIFTEFFDSSCDGLILEDIDNELMDRKEGNPFMYKLLATSDGMISNSGKKIILSTNLPTIKDIDEALIRPGRCYDVLKTRALTRHEAEDFASKLGIKLQVNMDSYSLADIYKEVFKSKVQGNPLNTGKSYKVGFTSDKMVLNEVVQN
jgi:hypothetical protein